LTGVEVDGRPGATVRIAAGRIVAVDHHGTGGSVPAGVDAPVLDGRGGAVIAGLRDHHLHLLSTAARRSSVACGPPEVTDAAGLRAALAGGAADAGTGGWVRGYGYDESVAGPLDAATLDRLLGEGSDHPVRVQHRSGHAWVLNGRAIRELGVGEVDHRGVDRDPDGRPTGVLFDLDPWLREAAGPAGPPDPAPVGESLARFGVTGFTDASAANGPAELELVESACESGRLGQRVLLLGGGELPVRESGAVRTGQLKVMLVERDLPSFDELVATIRGAGARGAALHCVTRETLVLAASALAVTGGGPHRVEHASVAPPEVVALVRASGATVVTQPAFAEAHGDRYLRDVEAADLPWLYRLAGWEQAGVPLAAGSDSPFGPLDPWVAIRAAVDRHTAGGQLLGAGERLRPEAALALYQGSLGDPGGGPRRVAVGEPADLCVLRAPWHEARLELRSSLVRMTVVAGRVIWHDPG
jgi:predicted amidohydrolase YtcJ